MAIFFDIGNGSWRTKSLPTENFQILGVKKSDEYKTCSRKICSQAFFQKNSSLRTEKIGENCAYLGHGHTNSKIKVVIIPFLNWRHFKINEKNEEREGGIYLSSATIASGSSAPMSDKNSICLSKISSLRWYSERLRQKLPFFASKFRKSEPARQLRDHGFPYAFRRSRICRQCV